MSGEIQALILKQVEGAIVKLVAKFVPGVGLVESFRSLYDLASWFLAQSSDPKSGINTLWTSLKNSFGSAVDGRVDLIGDAVNIAIQSALESVIGALLKIFVGTDLKMLIGNVKAKSSELVIGAARSILKEVGKPIQTVLGKIYPIDAGSGPNAIPGKKLTRAVASKDGKTKAWLQVKDNKIVVVVSQSPPKDETDSKQPGIQNVLRALKKDGADLDKKVEGLAKSAGTKSVSKMGQSRKQNQKQATQQAETIVKPIANLTQKVEGELQQLADNYQGAGCESRQQGALVHNASLSPCPSTLDFDPGKTEMVMYGGKMVERATGVVAIIVKAGEPYKPFDSNWPSWWDDFKKANPITGLGWRKGHLLGSQFGGPGGKTAGNMAPQAFLVNNSANQRCDNRIKDALMTCGCVLFSVKVNYKADGDPLRPESFTINAETNGGVKVLDNVVIQNVPDPPIPGGCK